MKVRFLADYRGPLTKETYYRAGSVADLPNGEASKLIRQGYAELAEPKLTEPTRKSTGKQSKRR